MRFNKDGRFFISRVQHSSPQGPSTLNEGGRGGGNTAKLRMGVYLSHTGTTPRRVALRQRNAYVLHMLNCSFDNGVAVCSRNLRHEPAADPGIHNTEANATFTAARRLDPTKIHPDLSRGQPRARPMDAGCCETSTAFPKWKADGCPTPRRCGDGAFPLPAVIFLPARRRAATTTAGPNAAT